MRGEQKIIILTLLIIFCVTIVNATTMEHLYDDSGNMKSINTIYCLKDYPSVIKDYNKEFLEMGLDIYRMELWASYNKPIFNFLQFFVNGEVELGGGVMREFFNNEEYDISGTVGYNANIDIAFEPIKNFILADNLGVDGSQYDNFKLYTNIYTNTDITSEATYIHRYDTKTIFNTAEILFKDIAGIDIGIMYKNEKESVEEQERIRDIVNDSTIVSNYKIVNTNNIIKHIGSLNIAGSVGDEFLNRVEVILQYGEREASKYITENSNTRIETEKRGRLYSGKIETLNKIDNERKIVVGLEKRTEYVNGSLDDNNKIIIGYIRNYIYENNGWLVFPKSSMKNKKIIISDLFWNNKDDRGIEFLYGLKINEMFGKYINFLFYTKLGYVVNFREKEHHSLLTMGLETSIKFDK